MSLPTPGVLLLALPVAFNVAFAGLAATFDHSHPRVGINGAAARLGGAAHLPM